MSALSIQVNGAARSVAEPVSLAGLLLQLGLDSRMVVVERNREIVRRGRLEEVLVQDGDVIELVHFVGGG
jgi:thiamine biosynthesis protein ThiS